ncbi:MAG: beta-glucosidase [Bryobacterales bacterium]|nr:beta-glucosidase [Bryobacterales bacterium]
MFVFRSLIGLVVACGAPTGATAFAPNASPGYKYPFQNPTLRIEERVTNILSLMTLEEKINCLGTDPDVPRLGTKGSGHIEGLHGVALGGPGHLGGKSAYITTTQFPQAVGLGETWDPDVLQGAAHVEAEEASMMPIR